MATIIRAGAQVGSAQAGMEKALGEIAAKLDKGGTLRVGFLEGSTAPNGDSLPLRAALNEFGHGNVPPRPFFRRMIQAKSGEWPEAIAHQLKATNYDVDLTLRRTGVAIKGQLQRSILDLWSPALSPVTVAKKGFAKPLIEHGDMINAVDFEVNVSGAVSRGGNAGNAASFQKMATGMTPPTK